MTATTDTGLAAYVRSATAVSHQEAEEAQFIQDLMAGRLPVVDYARLVAQHHAIYATIEALIELNTDPSLEPFFDPALTRLPALEEDLHHLAGSGWADKLPVLDSTRRYCDLIRASVQEWPGRLLAHHYVRYLGDLSGGQLIRKRVEDTYRFVDGNGTAFYRFEQIERPGAFKAKYRQDLDDLVWDDEQRQAFVDEASLAFSLHGEVFAQLNGRAD